MYFYYAKSIFGTWFAVKAREEPKIRRADGTRMLGVKQIQKLSEYESNLTLKELEKRYPQETGSNQEEDAA